MSIILDLILVAIFLWVVFISAKQGFVRIAVEVAGFIAVFLLVAWVRGPLADVTYQKLIEPPIVNSATEIVGGEGTLSADTVWKTLPEYVTQNPEKFAVTKEKLQKTIDSSGSKATGEIMSKISQEYVKPPVKVILETLYSVILIVVLLIAVKVIAKVLNKAFSFSVVGKLNRTLGGVLGIVKGVIVVLAFCELVELIISFTDNGFWIFNSENIDKTYIFNFLTNVF